MIMSVAVEFFKYPLFTRYVSKGTHINLRTPWNRQRRIYSTLPTTRAQQQTIYALATPPGKGGVAIVRVSGPDALRVWRRMVRPWKTQSEPVPWKLHHCRIVHPENETLIDEGLAVYFRG